MARDTNLKVRINELEEAMLEQIGEEMAKHLSGFRNADGSINLSAVVRRLIRQENERA